MNVLLLPCHTVLEYDLLRMWSDIPNVNLMSPGSYWEPDKGSALRPPLGFSVPKEWIDGWNTIKPGDLLDHKLYINKQAVEPFDIIVVMHEWKYIFRNWHALKNKNVVWYDIGQTEPGDETDRIKRLKELGVKIVRYWDGYQTRKDYQGHDAVIPFGKYPEDFNKWEGGTKSVIGLCQAFKKRADVCRYECWETSTNGLPRALFGNDNDGVPGWVGEKDYSHLINGMLKYNAMWYGGTKPAPYTLGLMEAMFIGIPIYAVRNPGWESALVDLLPYFNLANSSEELRLILSSNLEKPKHVLRSVSEHEQETALDLWDANKIKRMWEKLFKSL